MSLLPNEPCFSKYCWSVYEQKSIVNSFCSDDWTAEWAISASSGLRYQYPNYTFPCDNCNLTKGICSEKGIGVKAVFFPYGCQDFYIFSALNILAGISWLTDANIYYHFSFVEYNSNKPKTNEDDKLWGSENSTAIWSTDIQSEWWFGFCLTGENPSKAFRYILCRRV